MYIKYTSVLGKMLPRLGRTSTLIKRRNLPTFANRKLKLNTIKNLPSLDEHAFNFWSTSKKKQQIILSLKNCLGYLSNLNISKKKSQPALKPIKLKINRIFSGLPQLSNLYQGRFTLHFFW